MSTNAERFVERAGLVFEAEGLPRMAGRVLGHLMTCTPAEQSIASIMKAQQASNGSISTMTRLLESQGYIERLTFPGDRKDYFRLRPGAALAMLTGAQRSMDTLRQLFDAALALDAGQGLPQEAALEEARDLFTFLAAEYPAILERWRSRS